MIYPDFNKITLDIILLFALAFIFLLQTIYFFVVYGKVAFHKFNVTASVEKVPVSVIICARNEGENLTEFLPEVLTQNYPNYEVIVVNDCSSDYTDDVMREFSKVFPSLKSITVKEDDYYKHGKKFALMVGIKGAKYEHLIFTDADCKPTSKEWLSLMASGFTSEKQIVLGYGGYFAGKGFLNKLIRFDTFIIGLQFLSSALRKNPIWVLEEIWVTKRFIF